MLCVIFIISCAPRRALTPEDAYYGFKAAYLQGNDEEALNFLSSSTIKKMEDLIKKIKSFDDSKLQALALSMKCSIEELKTITPAKIISLQRRMDKNERVKIISFFESKPATIKIHENWAEIINESGIKMVLVKEGPYWKFSESIF